MKVHSVAHDAFSALNDPRLAVKKAQDVPVVLAHLVEKIARIAKADACSLYLYDPEEATLTLKATHGLNTALVDVLKVTRDDGLTGLVLKLLKPISIADVTKSADFKFVPELGEDGLRSFLAVPLVYNGQPVGVMVAQKRKPADYRKKDIHLLLGLAIPALTVIERAKFLGAFGAVTPSTSVTDDKTETYLVNHHVKGIPAAPGVAMGRMRRITPRLARRRNATEGVGEQSETQRLRDAFAAVANEIRKTKEHAEKKFGPDEASIFEAYLLFLESEGFKKQIVCEIESGKSAVNALENVVKKYMDRIAQGGDEYLKERAYDIQDIAHKIVDHLLYGESSDASKFAVSEATVFMNDTWSASDFVHLDTKLVKGVVSASGGASSHVAILAESLGLPAILGLGAAASQIRDGDFLIVDGTLGHVIVNPSTETIDLYRRNVEKRERTHRSHLKDRDKPVRLTRSGHEECLTIGANIEMASQTQNALHAGADEIGLFRTEFPYLVRRTLPTEEELYHAYRHVLRAMKNRPVTFRTLDIGGDKSVAYLDIPKEDNPALGWRSIRFSLARKDLFRIQLRALLKASVFGKARILFPMIATVEQALEAGDVLESVKRELLDEGLRVAPHIPVGYMIEIPAAALIAGSLLETADFLSIGTNDLVQYCLAVDRTNPKVAALYDPYHPAVLTLIRHAAATARQKNKPVSVCGDMAANPLFAPLLWAFGVTSLSMNPGAIPATKTLLRRCEEGELKKLASKILGMASGRAVHEALLAFFKKKEWGEFVEVSQAPN